MVQKDLKEYDEKIHQLESEIVRLKKKDQEPIAIIGVGCRFPGGANDPKSFWQRLEQGYSAVAEVPSDRWDLNEYYSEDEDIPGKMYTKYGAFIDNLDMFEPEFFSLTPREAERMDPQQRLFLEVAWEAIESAGLRVEDLFESKTGVYLGISSHDFVTQYLSNGMRGIDGYYGTGTQFSLAVGRLSYWLGLQGPSMVIDTACSSSLVALHQACQSLRSLETNIAIAGGVHLMITPELTIYCSKAKMISRDGKCKTFDEKADGYGRGEGCGTVILKRLSDAERDNDNILAIIRGSLVNQDGKSAGITAPNRISQEKLIKETLSRYSIHPGHVSYIECHGTGTILGDPIELTALQNVFEEFHNTNNPLYLGSVKANISHLEAAAGIAGMVKLVLALKNKKIPPHINFSQLNPHVSFCQDTFVINKELADWIPQNGRRIAGISSFGFSGTNAFALVEEAPERNLSLEQSAFSHDVHVLSITAKNADALKAYVKNYIDYLGQTEDNFMDICFSANNCRSIFSHRLAVMAKNKDDCRKKLLNYLSEEEHKDVFQGVVKSSNNFKLGFYFPAQIDLSRKIIQQYLDSLCNENPIIRNDVGQINHLLQKKINLSLRDILGYNTSGTTQPENSHLLTFLVEYITALQWIRYGATPDLFVVEGVGEYVAACLEGFWSLENTLEVICKLSTGGKSNNAFDSVKDLLNKISRTPIKTLILGSSSGVILEEGDLLKARDWWEDSPTSTSRINVTNLVDKKKNKYIFVGFGSKLDINLIPVERLIWINSMDSETRSWSNFVRNLLTIYIQGKKIIWSNFYKGLNPRKRILPSYPFRRRRVCADFGSMVY